MFWALVRFGLGGCEDLRTLLTSALSSSASCWLSLVQAASMAVMYSKLGGCLGVTAKLGPLARTDLCTGVKGLLDRLMTHLGLGSSLEEPWLDMLGGVEGGTFPGGCAGLRGRLSGLMPGGMPGALPACTGGVTTVPWLGCPMGLRIVGCRRRIGLGRMVFFPCGSGPGLRGRAGSFREKLYSSRGRTASFPRRKVSNCWCLVVGRTLTICLIAYWVWIYWITYWIIIIASLIVNGTVAFQRRVDSCLGRVVSFPGGKESIGRSRIVGLGRGLNLPV